MTGLSGIRPTRFSILASDSNEEPVLQWQKNDRLETLSMWVRSLRSGPHPTAQSLCHPDRSGIFFAAERRDQREAINSALPAPGKSLRADSSTALADARSGRNDTKDRSYKCRNSRGRFTNRPLRSRSCERANRVRSGESAAPCFSRWTHVGAVREPPALSDAGSE